MGSVIRKWPREMAKTTCSYIRFNEERNSWKIKLCKIAKGLKKVRIIWARSICTELSWLGHQSHVFLRKTVFLFFLLVQEEHLTHGNFCLLFSGRKMEIRMSLLYLPTPRILNPWNKSIVIQKWSKGRETQGWECAVFFRGQYSVNANSVFLAIGNIFKIALNI